MLHDFVPVQLRSYFSGLLSRFFSRKSKYPTVVIDEKFRNKVFHAAEMYLRKKLDTKVWDGIDVEGEELEEAKDDVVSSLEEMDDNKKVDHFSHEHGLSRIHVDEECWQLCEACIHPIAVGTFLGCKECSFALHEECARLPLEMDHPLHRHRVPNEHQRRDCGFTEPFKHSTHKCPLYLRLEDNTKSNLCCGCREDSTSTVATCTTCEDYYLDFKCLNLPPVVRFKYDTHPLYL
ncbi:hypothetical protein HID58_056036 [Brassica napus]|uniref:DC1 domain-containing protein n=1 Tax=Brassica napus TaxID=3708 RepID=A0ABQ8AM66_BRANA|nr:hypothetical protein HID58_056036 [Brassica napus]